MNEKNDKIIANLLKAFLPRSKEIYAATETIYDFMEIITEYCIYLISCSFEALFISDNKTPDFLKVRDYILDRLETSLTILANELDKANKLKSKKEHYNE
ncbi:MAG: hypothetical protein ACTSQE_12375 [Candidatus Heimdallarchaeaceae archaeon]